MTRIYSGTATVTNGDATVVITAGDPLTSANCPVDAPISLNGFTYHVASRTDTTHLELTRTYDETSGAVTVEIDPLTPDALSVVNIAVLVARVQAQLNVLDKNSQGLFYTRIGVTGDTDPAPGNLAFDEADPTAVTELYIDNLDANQRPVTGLLDLWTAGTVVLIRSLATTAYAAYRLPSGIAVQSGYYKGETQYVDHDGVLADGEAISIGWFRVGEGLEVDATGTLAGRAAYNTAAAGFVYLADTGNLYRKNSATSGDWGPAVPIKGQAGDTGWAPRFAVVADSERRVLQLAGYVGGTGTAPTANIGQYVSTGGYTSTIGSATDIRGGTGATGASAYQVAVANGFSGDIAAWLASLEGSDGFDGLDGTDPGVIMIWDNGVTDANPGSGVVRANNALTSSAAFLYVSKTNRPGNDISVFLATLDDSNSTRKGVITLTKSGGGAQATFDVTGITDATGYVKVAVTNGAGATFANNDIVSFQFAPSGDRGTNGTGAGNFVTPDTPAIDPTGYLVKFTDATGAAGATSGILASDVPLKSQNLADVGNRTTANDNLHANGADIASAATVNLETATGAFVEVTGTVATAAVTLADGHHRLVRAAGAWPLTHGANLQIQGGASYTCAAGDLLFVQADGAVVRVTIFPIDALPVAKVTNAKLADMATARFKGRTTAGTGATEDLTATQATAILNSVVGDSGTGGTKGLVPPPAAGDAAANKFLKADGTWAAAASNASFGIVAAIGASKGMGTRLFLPNALADGFRGADGVGVTSSNYLQDTAVGRVYPSIATTMIPQATGTNIGNATDIGGLAASFDGVTAQTSAVVSRGTATGVAAYVGKNYSAAPKKIVSATVYASSNLGFDSSNSAATYEVRLYGKNGSAPANSTDGTLLATVTGADAAAAVANLTSSDSATAFDYVWVRVSTNLSGEFYYIAEAQFYTPSIANMTLITAAALIDIVPASIKACLILRPFEAMTLNTDLTLRVSRDGGTTWSSATLVQVNTLGTDRYLETAKIVVSGQPSGSSIVAEIKTLNNKSCEIRGFEFEAF